VFEQKTFTKTLENLPNQDPYSNHQHTFVKLFSRHFFYLISSVFCHTVSDKER